MTAEQIADIRAMRACGVPWRNIAKQLGCSVEQCRAALGLPTYDRPAERRTMPWDLQQRTLFD